MFCTCCCNKRSTVSRKQTTDRQQSCQRKRETLPKTTLCGKQFFFQSKHTQDLQKIQNVSPPKIKYIIDTFQNFAAV